MFKHLTILMSVGLFVGLSEAAYYPSYIVPCSRSDPKLNECAMERGKAAMPYLVKGDKKLKVRPLDPLGIPEILIDTSNLKIHLVDSQLRGLAKMELRDLDFDLKNKKMSLGFYCPQFDIEGTYNISGQILILPITGSGHLKASIYKAVIGYTFKFDLVERDGKTYVDPLPPVVTLDAPNSSYNLENLFNGDKRLGDEMNKFLNENHDVMLQEIGPSVRETISAIATDIVQKILAGFAYDDLLLP